MSLSHSLHQEEQSPQGHEALAYRFLALAQESADVFWLLNPEGEMSEGCPSWHTFTGQREADCLGRGWLDALHPVSQPQIGEIVIQAVATGRTTEIECHMRRRDGGYCLVHLRVIPVREPSGTIREIVICGTDITTQELSGQMSEAQVQLAVKASHVGMWDWDCLTEQLLWTDQEKALFGWSPETPVTRERFLEAVHPDDREHVEQIMTCRYAQQRERCTDYRVIWPDGSMHWLSDRAQSITDMHDQPLHLIGATIDITEPKQAEERTTALLESITDAFVHVDAQWRYTYINRRAEEYAGKSREDLLGRCQWEVFPGFLGTPFEHGYRQAMEMQQVMHFEAFHPIFQKWFETHVYPSADGLSIYLHDITAQKQAEEHLQEANKRAEESLWESREKFRVLIETMPQLAWIAGPEGKDEYFNQRWYDYTQSTPEQALRGNWIHFVHPDDQRRAQEAWDTAVRTGQPYEATFRLRDGKTGAYQWFLERGLPLADAQGCTVKWYGTYTNIDEQQRAEEAMRQSRDAFRLLTEALPQLVWTARPDGYREYANQRWYDYTGSTAEHTLGEGWASCYHPDDRVKMLTLWKTSLLTSQPFEVEARLRESKTGAYQWFLIRGVPITDRYRKVWKWFGTATNIHKQKYLEEVLHESEVRLHRLMESNLIGITVIDLEGAILEANEAFLELLGYTRQDLAAGRMNWIVMTPPEHQERSAQAAKELRTTGVAQSYEKEYLAKDGKRVSVLIGGTLLRREGSPQLAISFVLDLTARKEIERQNDLMLGMTSHELKTPLAALKGTLQLAQQRLKRVITTADHLSPEMSTFFEGLAKNLTDSVRLIDVQTHLINDLLDVSRITTSTLKLSLHPCELGNLLRETVEDLRVTAPSRSLQLEVPEHITVTVLADADRISQVVANYVINALRYSSPDQPVHIGLTIQEDSARVWVQDRGPGLTEETQKELWQRFHQVKGVPVLSGSGKGLGLGLYICQTLIAQHQGEVGVESTPGEGSTFWFTLPMVK